MIDRGALLLRWNPAVPYRGLHRTPLDGAPAPDARVARLYARYREALASGDGVLEDLDDALTMRLQAERAGARDVEVIVFEVPQERAQRPGALPIATAAPAAELELLGYDVCELMEPWWSCVRAGACEDGGTNTMQSASSVNAHGLLESRQQAERCAAAWNARAETDEQVSAVRVYRA